MKQLFLAAIAWLALTNAHASAQAADAAAPMDVVITEPAEPPSRITEGRGLHWGATLIAPVVFGNVQSRAMPGPIDYFPLGGGAEARVGYELPHGLSLGAAGGVAALASDNSRAVSLYRALVEARWTIDVGSPVVAPTFSLAAGLELAQLGDSMGAAFLGRAGAGLEIEVLSWFAIEVGAAFDVAPPIDLLVDTFYAVTPRVTLTFFH